MDYYYYLNSAGVPAHLRAEALEYFEASERRYKEARIGWHKLTAWLVVGWLLLRRWGNPETDRSTPGVVVHELRGHWSLYVVEPAPFGLIVRRNVGVKLAMAVANMRRRAPIVNIKWSLVRAKKNTSQ